jgi:hypothetical protein
MLERLKGIVDMGDQTPVGLRAKLEVQKSGGEVISSGRNARGSNVEGLVGDFDGDAIGSDEGLDLD